MELPSAASFPQWPQQLRKGWSLLAAPPGSSTCWQGPKYLSLFLLPLRVYISRKSDFEKDVGLKPTHQGSKWNAGVLIASRQTPTPM